MKRSEAIELINSLVVIEAEGDGEILFYAYVRDDEKTREVLDKLNADDWLNQEWLNRDVGYFYVDYFRADHDKTLIDISPIAFEYAMWFDGDKFLEYAP